MSSSSQGAVLDPMDTTSHPSPRTEGNEPPPPPSPRDEAGAADGGNRPGPRHGDHQSGSSSSSTSAKTASIQGGEDPGAAGVLSGTPQQELEQAHPRPINRPEEVTNMQLSSRLDPQHTSIGSRGSPSPAAFPMSPAPGATPGTLTSSMNDSASRPALPLGSSGHRRRAAGLLVPSPQSPHFLSERPHSLLIATQLERARQTPVRSEVPRH